MSMYDKAPSVASSAFVAPSASVIGDVALADKASVYYGAVLRGDASSITVGAGTNLQDGVVVKTTAANPTAIGADVTVGHNAVLTGCTVGDNTLIGMGAVVSAGAVVEGNAFVAAGAVVEAGTTVPANEMWAGNPAKKLKDLTAADVSKLTHQASEYVTLSAEHAAAF